MLDNNFREYVKCAVHHNELTDDYLHKICDVLTDKSPCSNEWYYSDGFFRVDVVKNDYDKYISFIEELIGCSYCHVLNNNGLTFMISLTTLNKKL